MSFVIINSVAEVAALPDGTLISWLPVMDDPSSEAVAFVRRPPEHEEARRQGLSAFETWIAPGNGWAPEPLTSIVFPARIILLGVPQPGDYVPRDYLTSTDESDEQFATNPVSWPASEFMGYAPVEDQPPVTSLSIGGTYPRDIALQAAAAVHQGLPTPVATDSVIIMATEFADWLTADPESDLISQGVLQRDDSGAIQWGQTNG